MEDELFPRESDRGNDPSDHDVHSDFFHDHLRMLRVFTNSFHGFGTARYSRIGSAGFTSEY